ncbi:ribosome maturation factor RimP [Kocuria palustris]|uniref:ribosome maturation factor RimP n=1 Tax=Kocuria palustris TaxID=71999 RepID=UPI0011A19807|nr:ribosome maturation factor RimP [Kocuria palustris]
MSENRAQDPQAADLQELLAPVVEAEGLFLEDVTLSGTGPQRVLQVLVDLPEDRTDGVDLDDVARAARAVSDELDRADPVGGPGYELEVSSPGASRTLEKPRHWRRSIGRLVDVHPVDRTSHGRSFEARLLEVQDDRVTLQRSTQVKKGMPVKLLDPETWAMADIRQARVRVED